MKMMVSSCTLKEFLQLVSGIVKEYEDEDDFVNLLVDAMREEKIGVSLIVLSLR